MTLSNRELRVNVFPQGAAGDPAFSMMQSKINWDDFTKVPLSHLLSYFDRGMPWGDSGEIEVAGG